MSEDPMDGWQAGVRWTPLVPPSTASRKLTRTSPLARRKTFFAPGAIAWERERRERIVGKRSISVQLSDLTIDVQKGQATAKFQQAYKANNFQSNSRKTLTLEERNGKWLIVRETVGG